MGKIIKGEIVNVLEIINGVPNQIESWVIPEDSSNLKQDVVKEAEEYMIKRITASGTIELSEEEINYILEEGSYNDDNGHEVYLIWSN